VVTSSPSCPEALYAQRLVARNMRRTRLNLQLTQEQVAERSGTTPVWISGCERGERNLSVRSLSLIAYALGVSMAALLNEEDHSSPDMSLRVYTKRRTAK
jgi:XRE family transcriptional regulator, regulator of sulfur utilization